MVGTGANRMPLTKVHPILLGQKKASGGSLLSQYRQQHQERLQQMNSSPNAQVSSSGHQDYSQYQYQPRPQINQQMFNQQPPPDSYNKQPASNNKSQQCKRKSRWGAKEDRASMSGLVTLPANISEDQRKHYLVQFKIEEISQKLRSGDLGISADPAARSPSPEPIYNSDGKRLNTREYRVRKQLEDERHALIKKAIEEIPDYKPPLDYKVPLMKMFDKVFIPAEKNPAVNFIGLLIGPRGNTLRRLEKETGCKIIIRGRGSVKEGKVGRIPGQLMPGEDEPLHALITGPTEGEVKKGVEVVTAIVKEGVECPDAANELRRNQLRELAELNGTLIDEDLVKCRNCGATDHKHWECQEQRNVTSQITCHNCGGYGHVAVDCKVRHDASTGPMQTFAEKAKMDTEYMSLMAELGVEGPPPPKRTFQEQPAPKVPQQPAKSNKWGPPATSNATQFSGKQQTNGSTPQSMAPPPWMRTQGTYPPPPQNAVMPPWQQTRPGVSPQQPYQIPGYTLPPSGNMATGYPRQMGSWQPMYGAYNPYQQPQQPPPPSGSVPTSYAAPPPPWTQQPPPPPPPPPPSS